LVDLVTRLFGHLVVGQKRVPVFAPWIVQQRLGSPRAFVTQIVKGSYVVFETR